MSRTFRRKNWEKHQRSYPGGKTNGFYTEYDLCVKTDNGHGGYYKYRPMTEAEKSWRYWNIHGESKHNNGWGPNRFYRKLWKTESKRENDRQLRKHLNSNGEYDPVFYSNWPSQRAWWAW